MWYTADMTEDGEYQTSHFFNHDGIKTIIAKTFEELMLECDKEIKKYFGDEKIKWGIKMDCTGLYDV